MRSKTLTNWMHCYILRTTLPQNLQNRISGRSGTNAFLPMMSKIVRNRRRLLLLVCTVKNVMLNLLIFGRSN